MSAKSEMESWRCNLHNAAFKVEVVRDSKGERLLVRCPYCMAEEINKLRGRLEEVTTHRDTLLSAIDLKRLLEPVHGT